MWTNGDPVHWHIYVYMYIYIYIYTYTYTYTYIYICHEAMACAVGLSIFLLLWRVSIVSNVLIHIHLQQNGGQKAVLGQQSSLVLTPSFFSKMSIMMNCMFTLSFTWKLYPFYLYHYILMLFYHMHRMFFVFVFIVYNVFMPCTGQYWPQ